MTDTIDTYLFAYRKFLTDGLLPQEAMGRFDQKLWMDNALVEILQRGTREMLQIAASAMADEYDAEEIQKAYDLWGAGWASDPGNPPRRVFSWYWRAPAKKGRQQGRFYPSTNQAWNKWRKDNPEKPLAILPD